MNTVVIICVLALVGACSALNCYVCTSTDRSDDCWTWPQTTQVSTNCSACMTTRVTSSNGDGDALSRICWSHAAGECTETRSEMFGMSVRTTCCNTDNCNNEPPMRESMMMSDASFRQHASLSALLVAVFFVIL